jgi:DNA polymerase eta
MIPRGEVEKASIDEAFLDLTPMVIERLLSLHPHLANVPEDAPDGLDSTLPKAPPIDWTKAGNVFPVNGEVEESAGASGEGEGEGHEHEEAGEQHVWSSQKSDDGREIGRGAARGDTWEDWALCLGAELMADVRGEVWRKLHYTCSAVSLLGCWVSHRLHIPS